jgi:peptide/nickel transport system permease protein
MQRYIVRRLLLMIPTILGASLIVFFILELVPADPALMLLGQEASEEQLEVLREQMGLNDPFWIRYGRWLWGAVRGDFGTSLLDHRPVLPVVLSRLPVTLKLMAAAVTLALVIGIPAGIISALFPNRIWDFIFRIIGLAGLSVPSFWLALLLILAFAYHLKVLPIGGHQGWKNLILPSITLGTSMAALIMRLTRSAILNVMQEDYIRTARAKGLAERVVVVRHALRNALLPVVTVVGLDIGYLLGGTVIVETIFEWPGIGKYAYLKMLQRDYPAIMANLFLFALFFSLVNLITDITYSYLDPRIRYD